MIIRVITTVVAVALGIYAFGVTPWAEVTFSIPLGFCSYYWPV